MIFTVLSYLDLEPLIELDDYISVIWNNKYFTAGEFEIVLRTTPERIKKIVRNNYIVLNKVEETDNTKELDEIGIINLVQYSKDEDNGATMTVKGSFAQSLLNRRIIWDKVTISGNIEEQLRTLIENNAINPTNTDRAITADTELASYSGKEIDLPEYYEFRNITFICDTTIINNGTPSEGRITGFEFATSIASYNYYVDGKQYTMPATDWYHYLSNPLDTNVKTEIYKDIEKTIVREKCQYISLYDGLPSSGSKGLIKDFDYSFTNMTSYYLLAFSYSLTWIATGKYSSLNYEEEKFLSNHFVALTKELYEDGALGFSIYDNVIYFRLKISLSAVSYAKEQVGEDGDWQAYLYDIVTFKYASNTGYEQFDFNSFAIGNLKEVQEKEYTNIAFEKLPKNGITRFEIINSYVNFERVSPSDYLADYLYIELVKREPTDNKYLALGNRAGLANKIELQLYGENLGTRLEEILQLYGAGMKCSYNRLEKKIYLDFYKGENRASNIIFSENLDNLNSYIVNVGNVESNIALVYSKATVENQTTGESKEKEYTGVSGLGAGIYRRETFINKTEDPGYAGVDYAKQLVEEGTISLQSVALTIENEIDPYSYVYRTQYNLGDIVTITIKDLDITYNVRVLEVREYNDENGYTIDLVLGE